MVGTPLIQSRPAGGAGVAFACSDLNACSIAALGTKDHHLLDGLLDDDHSIYALLSGRSGGQAVIGDTASGGHLTLQSTAHATRGYIRAQDDVQLLSGYLRDSAGNARIQLAESGTNVAITGVTTIAGNTGITGNTAITGTLSASIRGSFGPSPGSWGFARAGGSNTADTYAAGVFSLPTGAKTAGTQLTIGVYGGATGAGTPANMAVYGLHFTATYGSANPCTRVAGVYVQTLSNAGGAATLTESAGLYIEAAAWTGSTPGISRGLYICDQGGSGVNTAYGLQINNQTAATAYLLEIGSAPYLRLVGGPAPAANCTHLWLAEGVTPTLRNVQWKLYSALVAGDRVCVLV